MQVDAELIRNCIKGNERAQEQLFKCSFQLLFGICMRYFNNQSDAQAALNKGFYRILTKLNQLQQSDQYYGWAKQVMISTVLNELKNHQRFKDVHEISDFTDPTENQELTYNELNERFDTDAILELLAELPQQEQQVVNLYAIDGYNHKEISELLSIPVGTSKWLLSNGRKRLAKSMKQILNQGIKSLLL